MAPETASSSFSKKPTCQSSSNNVGRTLDGINVDEEDDNGNIIIHNAPDQASPTTAQERQGSITTSETNGNTNKVLLVIIGSCSIFFYGGAFYGWGPMQLLLESNGNFQNKCSDEWWESIAGNELDSRGAGDEMAPESLVCPEQTSALLTCRFVGQLTVLTSPLWAYLSDKYGGQTLTYNLFSTMISGLVLLVIAFEFPGTKWDGYLLYTSFILIGIGSTCGGLLTVVTALLFDDHNSYSDNSNKSQSRVISLMNALYDSAAITYLCLWGLVQLTSNVVGVMIGYACVAVLFLGGYIVLFRRVRKQVDLKDFNDVDNEGSINDIEPLKAADEPDVHGCKRFSTTPTTNTMTDESTSRLHYVEENAMDNSIGKPIVCSSSPQDLSPDPSAYADQPSDIVQPNSSTVPYVTIAKRPFVAQIGSKAFILLCTFFTIHFMSNIWTLTTMRDFLKYLGDDEEGNKYLAIFTLLTPVSLVALPFVDVAIHRYGWSTALQAVNTLDMVQCLIKVIPGANLNIQIVGFVVFSFFRCFLFCVTLSCMPTFISNHAVARATSVIYVVSSAATFINIPLVNLAVESQGGNFFIPNLLFLFLTIPGGVIAWMLGNAIDRNRESHIVQ